MRRCEEIQLVGAKLVWRIHNLEIAAGAGEESLESGNDIVNKDKQSSQVEKN